MSNYGINDIETLSFKEGVRKRIQMYLGSNDMIGVYNGIQEIISNSIDEYYMGYGDTIRILINEENNSVTVEDFGRGIPFGIKETGGNVLVDIFSKPHTGGKFNDKVYNSVAGLNGIGAKATCLSSEVFKVTSMREGKVAVAKFQKGDLIDYKEGLVGGEESEKKSGTLIRFVPDKEVFNLEPIKVQYSKICEMCKNLSFLTKGLRFIVENVVTNEVKIFLAKDGLLDLVKDRAVNPINKKPAYFYLEDGANSCEVALQWTTNSKEEWYVFTNGIPQIEGGTPLTGMKIAITRFAKNHFGADFGGDIARAGLVFAVACKTPHPSFANQTKTKINNPELNGLAQKATGAALKDFVEKNEVEFNKVVNLLTKIRKADQAAERARKAILTAQKDIEKNSNKKVLNSEKLYDARKLGQDSILLVVEGDSAAGAMARVRDPQKYGIMGLKGKIINCLAHSDEEIFRNEEIKLLLSAMNIVPKKYNGNKLRYGKIAICTDADSDGFHIGLLIMAAFKYLAPEFIKEGRLCWLRAPLYVVGTGSNKSFYYTEEEMNRAYVEGKIKGEITRNKGLGEMSDDDSKRSMFDLDNQRLEVLEYSEKSFQLLEELMGSDAEYRKQFVFSNIDFAEIRE